MRPARVLPRLAGPAALGALLALTLAAGGGGAPCLRLSRPETVVQGDVRVCPGRYRVADRTERGVIVVASSGTRLDLRGVTIESGDTVPSRFVGVGIVSRGVDRVTILGGVIRGYRHGVRLEGGRGHRLMDLDASGSRSQALRSTGDRFDPADWLDPARPEGFDELGAGVYLKWTDGASVTGVTARDAQNGIALFGSRDAYLADNDVSANSGWGIHLWASSRNILARNRAHHVFRCESAAYSRGCGAAAILLRERSDSNLVVDNDLTYSADGLHLAGERSRLAPSVGNLILRNDASFAYHNAFVVVDGAWNVLEENRADSSRVGFWLVQARQTTLRRNRIIGASLAGIAARDGVDHTLSGNTIIGGRIGIHLVGAPGEGGGVRGASIDDNGIAKVEQGVVLERTIQARVRGNVFDEVGDALVVDQAGHATLVVGNVFLRAARWFIKAPDLAAGGNFWAVADVNAAMQKVDGRVSVLPWRPASAAGY
ncbi:MAG TPA: NosD domain-containing protein [Gemmatimonadales bacterium]|nr:NosD domain-containing protein [Gemmatimonadales bacterium]